jgi:hypothetical protein
MGAAADIYTGDPGKDLEKEARGSGFKAVGVADFWVHLDVRADRDRSWMYVKRKKEA